MNEEYPQAQEENEFRYLSPAWLDEIARGLTLDSIPQRRYARHAFNKCKYAVHDGL